MSCNPPAPENRALKPNEDDNNTDVVYLQIRGRNIKEIRRKIDSSSHITRGAELRVVLCRSNCKPESRFSQLQTSSGFDSLQFYFIAVQKCTGYLISDNRKCSPTSALEICKPAVEKIQIPETRNVCIQTPSPETTPPKDWTRKSAPTSSPIAIKRSRLSTWMFTAEYQTRPG